MNDTSISIIDWTAAVEVLTRQLLQFPPTYIVDSNDTVERGRCCLVTSIFAFVMRLFSASSSSFFYALLAILITDLEDDEGFRSSSTTHQALLLHIELLEMQYELVLHAWNSAVTTYYDLPSTTIYLNHAPTSSTTTTTTIWPSAV